MEQLDIRLFSVVLKIVAVQLPDRFVLLNVHNSISLVLRKQ